LIWMTHTLLTNIACYSSLLPSNNPVFLPLDRVTKSHLSPRSTRIEPPKPGGLVGVVKSCRWYDNLINQLCTYDRICSRCEPCKPRKPRVVVYPRGIFGPSIHHIEEL
jgi:hypothetical protein